MINLESKEGIWAGSTELCTEMTPLYIDFAGALVTIGHGGGIFFKKMHGDLYIGGIFFKGRYLFKTMHGDSYIGSRKWMQWSQKDFSPVHACPILYLVRSWSLHAMFYQSLLPVKQNRSLLQMLLWYCILPPPTPNCTDLDVPLSPIMWRCCH